MCEDALTSIRDELESTLQPERFAHSLQVEEESRRLAEKYGADVGVCGLAGLLHDCARDLPDDALLTLAHRSGRCDLVESLQNCPMLLHGLAGAVLAREKYGVEDVRVLRAIACHTLGSIEMSAEDKVVCLADYIEPGRNFPGVDRLRALAEHDLDLALLSALDCTILHLVQTGREIAIETVLARNRLVRAVNTNCEAGDPPAREFGEIAG